MKKISLLFLFSCFLFFKNISAQSFTPAVSIVSSQNNFCADSSVVIKATPVMGDTVLSYNFLVNGISQQNSAVDSFISTTFANNDSVICILHSGKYNAAPDSAISNKIYLQTALNPTASFTYTDSANVFKFTNTSTNATNYIWLFGDGSSSTAINPVNAYPIIGNFTAQLIAIGWCSNDTFSVSFTTGINDLVNPMTMQVYPNPATSELRIKNYELRWNKVEIINAFGQVCISIVNQKSEFINIENLSSGIYFLKTIDAKGNSANTKFIKE
jgi:PKD repeat protein